MNSFWHLKLQAFSTGFLGIHYRAEWNLIKYKVGALPRVSVVMGTRISGILAR